MVLKTWPPANRIPFYVTPELLPFLAERYISNIPPESPLSWTGVEDEPLVIDSDEENTEQVFYILSLNNMFSNFTLMFKYISCTK